MHPAAKIILALVPPEKAAWYALFALVLIPTLLALLFAGPAAFFERVPLATPGQVKLYTDAAKAASDSTKTACDPQGLQVNWKPLVAIEAVRLEQDFTRATRERAEEMARRFVEQVGTTKCVVGTDQEGKPVYATAPTFRLRPLDEVLRDLRLGADGDAKVRRYLAFDLDLVRDVGTECVPPGWTPREGEWRWPLPGHFNIASCFGPRVDPVEGVDGMHYGLDIAAGEGAPVVAARGGRVVRAGSMGECGTAVVLAHDDGTTTRYCHLSRTAVRAGGWFRSVRVEAGQVIGYVGSTGKSTGPHLHFEVRRGGVAADPLSLY